MVCSGGDVSLQRKLLGTRSGHHDQVWEIEQGEHLREEIELQTEEIRAATPKSKTAVARIGDPLRRRRRCVRDL
jgi:hypothetical protein